MWGCGCGTRSVANWRPMRASCGGTSGRALPIWRRTRASRRAAPASSPVFGSGGDGASILAGLGDRHRDACDDDRTRSHALSLVAIDFVTDEAVAAPAFT